ncbi:MAG: hypothetical protein EON96_04360 [Caulobacteraceae bacterium]|nr:MAG: hypothetical protein EON96_04360 [Caulobacteraceae bacterium]
MADAVVSVVNGQIVVRIDGASVVAAIYSQALETKAQIDAIYALIGQVLEVSGAYGGSFVQTAGGQMLDMTRPGEKPAHVQRAEMQAKLAKMSSGLPIFANRRALRKWRAQKGKLERRLDAGAGSVVKLKLGVGGDSWGDNLAIPQALGNKLYDEFGKGGEGWLSVNATTDSPPLNGVTFAKSGAWSTFDLSADQPPAGLCGIDGHSLSASATSSVTWANCVATEFRVYYEKTGTLTWQVDGGAVNTVATDGSGGLGILTIPSLSEVAHTLSLAWSAGTIKILGVYATITAKSGAELIKFGNSGLTGYDWTVLTTTAKNGMTAIAADIGLHAAMLIISTNDYRGLPTTLVWSPPSKTIDGLKAIRSCLAVPPIIVAPAQSNALAYQPQDTYRDAMWAYTQAEDLPFYNAHDDFPVWSVGNAEGRWKDDLHFNSDGGADFAAAVGANLLDLVP